MVDSQYIESKIRQETDFEMHRLAHECIAQGYLTNSKRPESLVMGVYPTHLVKGNGCYVWDAHKKKYVDFITGLGTNLVGYANETVNEAVRNSMQNGNLFSLGSPAEIEAAVTLKASFQFVDAWKFLKSGSEACSTAVRIARAYNGRTLILSEGYHGFHDGFVSLVPPAYGVVDKQFLRFELLKNAEIDEKVSAVIVEPVITDFSDERRQWLTELKEKCQKAGALLIFDEIITGFRFPRLSVASYWGIEPDIICLGKAMANGYPLAAVGGKYHVMNCNEYFISSTYAGCIDALVACKTVCSMMSKSMKIDELWLSGSDFQKAFNEIWLEKISIEGYPTRGIFKGDRDVIALFFQEACFSGFLFGPSFWYNFPLSKIGMDIIPTLKEILDKIRRGGVKLVGQPPRSPFAQKVREQ